VSSWSWQKKFLELWKTNALFQCLPSWNKKYTIGWNLIWTQLCECLCKSFIHMKTSFIKMQSQHGRINTCGLVLPFERFSFFLSRCLYFHDLDKFGENTYLFMSFTDIWTWWVGLCIVMGKVWFQIGVQLPLKVLVLVYILGLIVLNFKDRFELSIYSFLNANCTYLGKKFGSHILP